MTFNASLIFCDSSSHVSADVHCDLSFKIIIISLASIGIGSVGISPLPVFPTIFSISGNFSNNTCADCIQASLEVRILLPVRTRVSTAKSPSGNSGINSPPKLLNTKSDRINKANDVTNVIFGNFKIRSNNRCCLAIKKSIILSDQFFS